jgi:hypothetical protein
MPDALAYSKKDQADARDDQPDVQPPPVRPISLTAVPSDGSRDHTANEDYPGNRIRSMDDIK